MKTEKELLNQLRDLREIANTLPHPDYHLSKEILGSPRVRVFAQIEAILAELKLRYKYSEPEPDHPVPWVNDLLKGLGIKHMEHKHNVTIRGQVLSNGTYTNVEYVRIDNKVYYRDGHILDLEKNPTQESLSVSPEEAERLKLAAEDMSTQIPPIYPSYVPKSQKRAPNDN